MDLADSKVPLLGFLLHEIFVLLHPSLVLDKLLPAQRVYAALLFDKVSDVKPVLGLIKLNAVSLDLHGPKPLILLL